MKYGMFQEEMAVFCDPAHPVLNQILNYGFGVLFPLLFLVSLIFNPMVLYSNYRRKTSIARTLFMMLSVVDFITNSFQPLVVAVHLLSPSQCYTELDPPTTYQTVSTCIMAPVMQAGGMLTTLLAITRYITIRSPFYVINRAVLVVYSLLYITFLAVSYSSLILTSPHVVFDPYIQWAWRVVPGRDYWAVGLTIPYTIHCLLAAVTSILTVCELWGYKTAASLRGRKIASQRRGSLTILIMNTGNLIMFVFSVVYIGMKVKMTTATFTFNLIKFVTWCVLPLVLSAANPTVVVTRSGNYRKPWSVADSAFNDPQSKPNNRVNVGECQKAPSPGSRGS